jgi:hypothetical protein
VIQTGPPGCAPGLFASPLLLLRIGQHTSRIAQPETVPLLAHGVAPHMCDQAACSTVRQGSPGVAPSCFPSVTALSPGLEAQRSNPCSRPAIGRGELESVFHYWSRKPQAPPFPRLSVLARSVPRLLVRSRLQTGAEWQRRLSSTDWTLLAPLNPGVTLAFCGRSLQARIHSGRRRPDRARPLLNGAWKPSAVQEPMPARHDLKA